jgi:hypothetical protein
MNANKMSPNVLVSESEAMMVVSVERVTDCVEASTGVPTQDLPGVAISPANAGALRVRAKTVAVQIAFIVFMVFLSSSVFSG